MSKRTLRRHCGEPRTLVRLGPSRNGIHPQGFPKQHARTLVVLHDRQLPPHPFLDEPLPRPMEGDRRLLGIRDGGQHYRLRGVLMRQDDVEADERSPHVLALVWNRWNQGWARHAAGAPSW